MTRLLIFLMTASPAAAWEFTPGLPCVLRHASDTAAIELTYDPTQPLYTVTVSQSAPFDSAPLFSMSFEGDRPLQISTNRHMPSRDGLSVTVADRGFGNVLNGLQYNERVTATFGTADVSFSLAGAAPAVAAFRDCRAEAGV
ncbi:hypothetical protein [Roseobacter ponti]|uniref:Excinuclease ABC subunit B n=1 Tax=Roseobacter ponti TaxID=1891787 RepID=A0A858SNV1_9RHOB|nr:hypothetical protein [Roseobacter ponti]QJF50100.1 hypothetical protein G3256_02405 [Roseobacter ponti]